MIGGDESILRPHMICVEHALARHVTWKYLVNIFRHLFKKNLALLAAFKSLNGSNLVKSFSIDKFRET